MSKYKDPHPCPDCGESAKKVILDAPRPLIEAMADAGCPGAFHTSGDRIEKRHRAAGQYHTQTKAQKRDHDARHIDYVKDVQMANTKEG